LSGQLAWISDPIEGRRHDTFCLGESGALTGLEPGNWIGDKGYIGNDMLTPIKKPEFRPLLDWEKEFNTRIGGIRSAIERVIANIKTWRILHTDYRRPLNTFRQTISAVIGLHFWRGARISLNIRFPLCVVPNSWRESACRSVSAPALRIWHPHVLCAQRAHYGARGEAQPFADGREGLAGHRLSHCRLSAIAL
jgi:hypothetical protein